MKTTAKIFLLIGSILMLLSGIFNLSQYFISLNETFSTILIINSFVSESFFLLGLFFGFKSSHRLFFPFLFYLIAFLASIVISVENINALKNIGSISDGKYTILTLLSYISLGLNSVTCYVMAKVIYFYSKKGTKIMFMCFYLALSFFSINSNLVSNFFLKFGYETFRLVSLFFAFLNLIRLFIPVIIFASALENE